VCDVIDMLPSNETTVVTSTRQWL